MHAAFRLLLAATVLVVSATSGRAHADATSAADAADAPDPSEPLPTETLPATLTMRRCPGVAVVEWRPTASHRTLTQPTPAGVAVIEAACVRALARYAAFAQTLDLTFTPRALDVRLMLMPANLGLGGRLPRNLNDTTGRFRVVQPNCCSWGIYNDPTHAMFLRNDPLLRVEGRVGEHRYFTRTLFHELGHALFDQWSVREHGVRPSRQRNEELAEAFVAFLGIAYPTDSTDENLAILAESRDP